MGKGISEIFKKVKALTFLSLVMLSSVLIANMSSISTNPGQSTSNGMANTGLGESYADLTRPTFLQAGKYLNYSVSFSPIAGVLANSTNLSAYLYYDVNSISGQYYNLDETTSHLNIAYGYSNGNRTMGMYTTGVTQAVAEQEIIRAYSNAGPIRASSYNLTNFGISYGFNTVLNMYTANGSFSSASGNGTKAATIDSLLPPSQPQRVNYFGHYRTLVSYYGTLNALRINPKALYSSTIATGFSYNGTAKVSTYMGDRETVRYMRATTANNWTEALYFDMYTGILIKAILKVDKRLSGENAHELVYNLISTNVDFGSELPAVSNEFDVALGEIKNYLAESALNDTNGSLFYHAAMGGASTPSNSSKFSSDLFKILKGYSTAFSDSLQVLFAEINASALRDVANGGFYRSMNAAGTVDGVKTVTEAAWAILGTTHLGSVAMKFQQDMFNYMELLYTNGTYITSTFYAFTRSNASETVFYAYDNLIAFLALNWLANYHTNGTLKTTARAMASNVINLFYAPISITVPSFWDVSKKLFVTSIDKAGSIVDTDKSVLDASLAIYALSEWYLFNNLVSNIKEYVTRAILAFETLLGKAWNATNKGFIHELTINLDPGDSNQYLEDNAWAMSASLALLEAANYANNKKNITYYDVACDTWASIKAVFYDAVNKTFRRSSYDKSTIAGDLGVVLVPLAKMAYHSRSTQLMVSINSTGDSVTFERNKPVLATAKWVFNVQRSLPGLSLNISIPLNYSDVNFLTRYGNGTIYDQSFSVTNDEGISKFEFPLPIPPEFRNPDPTKEISSAHMVVATANRTGFEVASDARAFFVASSTSVDWDQSNPYVKFKFTTDTIERTAFNTTDKVRIPAIYPGENFSVTINMSNSFTVAQVVNITFDNGTLQRFSVLQAVNASTTNVAYTFNLQANDNIAIGDQNVTFSISKNGSAFFPGWIPFYVKTPIFITNVNYTSCMVDNGNYTLKFGVKNLNQNRNESVTVKFSSVNLVLASGSPTLNITDIRPKQEIPVEMLFRLSADASNLTQYEFTIDLEWKNNSMGSVTFLIPFRTPVEVLSISGPTTPAQNMPFLFSISVRNNRDTSVQAQIQVIRVMNNGNLVIVAAFNRTLVPGLNNILYSYVEAIQNPWDIGEREYSIVVVVDGAVAGRGMVLANVQMSLQTVMFAYVLVFGIIGILFLLVINKKRQLASIRR
nr:hypothetical protein [Candidatus Sigynarchaeota archaeon]